MKVYYFHDDAVVDCTADPHPVKYRGLEEMLEDIVRVCKSDLVQAIESVSAVVEGIEYGSDEYTVRPQPGREPATGRYAEQHKIAGLYFYQDGEPEVRHVPPGLTGLQEVVQLARERGRLESLQVYVVWSFAGASSCSDQICMDSLEPDTVDYRSQDWWIYKPGYEGWCQKMADLLGVPFPYTRPGQERSDYKRPQP